MRLLLDIGNTRIKWALQGDAGLTGQQAIVHADLDAAQLSARVFAPCGRVSAVLVANVAGEQIAGRVRQAVRDCWQFDPVFVTASAQAGVQGRIVRNAYLLPQQLGVDRWLAMLAAYALSPGKKLVVSVGTAMTLDAVDEHGQHLGGLIVPGPDLMTHSLLRETSDIAERVEQSAVPELPIAAYFANTTRACVQLGSFRAACSLIESVYQHLNPGRTQLVLTGGAAAVLQERLTVESQFIPDLVLQGLSHCE